MHFTGPFFFSKFLNDALSVLAEVLCDEEFFNFLLDWYTECFYFPVLHFAYNLNISFVFGFQMGWDLEISSSASSMFR